MSIWCATFPPVVSKHELILSSRFGVGSFDWYISIYKPSVPSSVCEDPVPAVAQQDCITSISIQFRTTKPLWFLQESRLFAAFMKSEKISVDSHWKEIPAKSEYMYHSPIYIKKKGWGGVGWGGWPTGQRLHQTHAHGQIHLNNLVTKRRMTCWQDRVPHSLDCFNTIKTQRRLVLPSCENGNHIGAELSLD